MPACRGYATLASCHGTPWRHVHPSISIATATATATSVVADIMGTSFLTSSSVSVAAQSMHQPSLPAQKRHIADAGDGRRRRSRGGLHDRVTTTRCAPRRLGDGVRSASSARILSTVSLPRRRCRRSTGGGVRGDKGGARCGVCTTAKETFLRRSRRCSWRSGVTDTPATDTVRERPRREPLRVGACGHWRFARRGRGGVVTEEVRRGTVQSHRAIRSLCGCV